jgi:methionine-rich copper-binding protein CopC
MKTILQALILSLTAVVAHAHTELSSSTPADEAVLGAAPEEIALHFSEPVRLTSLSIESVASGEQALGPLPSSANEEFAIESPSLSNGRYVVSWRALSADTHVMTGKFSFTVDSGPASSHSGH